MGPKKNLIILIYMYMISHLGIHIAACFVVSFGYTLVFRNLMRSWDGYVQACKRIPGPSWMKDRYSDWIADELLDWSFLGLIFLIN